jgi:large conductance mechanosensitive channel
MKVVNDLKTFILRGNVVELAVGINIGAAFTAIVMAFVKDLVTPLIAAVGGQPDFSSLSSPQ